MGLPTPQAKETREVIELAVKKIAANTTTTVNLPASQHTDLAHEIQRICKDALTSERKAKYAPLRILYSKLSRLRAHLQSRMSRQTPPYTHPTNKRSTTGQIRSQQATLARITNELARCERQIIGQE